ncbi:MAG: AAA-like domain-containing protein [Defluviitaleaceae bacterium]|nr:AAA-like domain-containing protein [Defluviitaleaceae bacterium]
MHKFNTTGLCTPEEDYMVDISGKIKQIRELVERRCYFTINRARQYGKTTTLNELVKALADEYIVISICFQEMGEDCFKSSELFCKAFIRKVVQALKFTTASMDYIKNWDEKSIQGMGELGEHIEKMCEGKKIVLIIDEVDRTSNNSVFLQFIDILRAKFLARKAGRRNTFHSVILAGVYDIKNIKLYNSPWNIAINFKVDMSFSATEIATMLSKYEIDHNTGMDVDLISKEIYSYTSGYPFLVSRLCQCIDEEAGRDWTLAGIQGAIREMLIESNTLFDDMFKNLENNKELSSLIYDLLIMRAVKPFVIDDPIVGIGVMYGFLVNTDDKIAIANKIFELRMVNYYISKDLRNKKQITGVLQHDIVQGGVFDMELCLRKFSEHYGEIFSNMDEEFLERHGRLLFLSYLKPLINGNGFYHIESQLIDMRRMDIVVDFGRQQFIIELKLWDGKAKQEDAYKQLCGYLESKHTGTGYLLTFDFRKNKKKKAEWLKIYGKDVFHVVV